eukprot:GDKI01036628.1.p1 GENE.GDKI01036628.1~~GDKI01036628.1.p1  ORF type:complete len:190 (-),score=50.02 GDKI01036628.1:280-849(-)
MGICPSRIWNRLSSAADRDCRIVMVGLDAAGKTTLLHKLRLPGEVMRTVPMIGFNLEAVECRRLHLMVWDVGGQGAIRSAWRPYYQSCDAIIFVVDASDTARFDTALEELHFFLSKAELSRAKLLVFANKQDVPGALAPNEVAKRLGLMDLRDREWHVQGCVAPSEVGLFEGIDWLTDKLTNNTCGYKA